MLWLVTQRFKSSRNGFADEPNIFCSGQRCDDLEEIFRNFDIVVVVKIVNLWTLEIFLECCCVRSKMELQAHGRKWSLDLYWSWNSKFVFCDIILLLIFRGLEWLGRAGRRIQRSGFESRLGSLGCSYPHSAFLHSGVWMRTATLLGNLVGGLGGVTCMRWTNIPSRRVMGVVALPLPLRRVNTATRLSQLAGFILMIAKDSTFISVIKNLVTHKV